MGKRVLITGASGFVGANLARRALRDGHDVHLLLRPNHASWRIREIADHVRIHEARIEDAGAVQAVVAAVRPEWVFHLAAYGAYSHQTGMPQMVATNLMGCVALLDACAGAGVESFVNAGSSSEYGFARTPPAEGALLEPNSHYAITKAAATHYCQLTARERDLHATTVRLYSVYGPFEEPTRLVPTLLLHARQSVWPPLVSPATARDFVYVDDAVDAMMSVARTPTLPRAAVYNVCSGAQTTMREIVETVRAMLAVNPEPVWGTMPQRVWDTDVWTGSPVKIQQELGWTARTSLADGLARTLAWLDDQPGHVEHYRERIFRR